MLTMNYTTEETKDLLCRHEIPLLSPDFSMYLHYQETVTTKTSVTFLISLTFWKDNKTCLYACVHVCMCVYVWHHHLSYQESLRDAT